jgi:hypothetical protein
MKYKTVVLHFDNMLPIECDDGEVDCTSTSMGMTYRVGRSVHTDIREAFLMAIGKANGVDTDYIRAAAKLLGIR